MTVNGGAGTTSATTDANGADALGTLTEAWFTNTLGWDFTTIWEWDSGNGRTKLR